MSTASVVMGMISLVGILLFAPIGLLLGPIAWTFGDEVLRSEVGVSKRRRANVGRICGILATALSIILLLVTIAMVFFSING